MDEWADWAFDQVLAMARQDDYCQELAQRHEACVGQFEALLARLSPRDRELVSDYLYLCQEIEHQRARLAYQLGKCRTNTQ